MQWVLGQQPELSWSLSADSFSLPIHDAAEHNDEFAENLQGRQLAAECFLRADASAKLRRALLRRSRPQKDRLPIGHVVYYWREVQGQRLVKVRWHGPAHVVACEEHPETSRPLVYWIVHGTSLIRCAPEQLRSAYGEELSHTVTEQARNLLSMLKQKLL